MIQKGEVLKDVECEIAQLAEEDLVCPLGVLRARHLSEGDEHCSSVKEKPPRVSLPNLGHMD